MSDYGSCFNIAHIENDSEIYGPGRRFVIWLQGCTFACRGCWNRDLWDLNPRCLVERELLLSDILSHPEIEGITLLGGEPLQQPENVCWLISKLKEINLSVVLYTGYEMKEISNDLELSRICEQVDILIPGRYREEERNLFLRWRGSCNQPIIFPTDRYSNLEIDDNFNEVELTIDEYGSITLVGYPNDQELIPVGRDG